MKHHPGKHELFEVVDEAYEKRPQALVAGKGEIPAMFTKVVDSCYKVINDR